MSEHTAGKWFLNTNLTQILNEDGHTIANVSPMGARTAEERDANARILHAAPELLEALKEVVEQLETYEPGTEEAKDALALLARIEGGE